MSDKGSKQQKNSLTLQYLKCCIMCTDFTSSLEILKKEHKVLNVYIQTLSLKGLQFSHRRIY